MAEEDRIFHNAVQDLLEAVLFESWLRFYFLRESGGQEFRLEIPAERLLEIEKFFPRFLPIAQAVNGREAGFETARGAVLDYALARENSGDLPQGMAVKVFGSWDFERQVQLFNAWVQMHEDHLERERPDFQVWLELFGQWLESPGAKMMSRNICPGG